MRKVNTILLALIAAAFAGYALYVNFQFKDTVKRYEASAADMAGKFEKINEDALKAGEELSRQKALAAEAKAEAEEAKAEAAKLIEEARQKAEAVIAVKEAEPVKLTKKEQQALEAKARAEQAKAKAEALIGAIDNEPNAWETREPHL